MNQRKTKIVAKIADNRSDHSFLEELFLMAGADVGWINTAHQNEDQSLDIVQKLRNLSPLIPILLDTKGPEVRTMDVTVPMNLKAGDFITLTGDVSVVGSGVVHVTYPNFHNEVPVGELILCDDGVLGMTVVEKTAQGLKCKIHNDGVIKTEKKSINVPNVHIHLPALSGKDISFVHFAAKNNIDFIIHSFVRNKSDIFEIEEILKQYPDYKGKILAKLENREGFENREEILDHCDGLMVARGDLGAEVPLQELPYMQKKMLESALKKGKYCIVATQVLDSMIKNPRPTRAEVIDVANAVLDGTCGVSMSGETAYGMYPIEATDMMSGIMMYTEKKRDELVHFTAYPEVSTPEYKTAEKFLEMMDKEVKAILVCTKNVDMTRALSAYRPDALVIPACVSDMDARNLMMGYAVRPVIVPDISPKTLVSLLTDSFLEPTDTVALVTDSDGGYVYKVSKLSEVK